MTSFLLLSHTYVHASLDFQALSPRVQIVASFDVRKGGRGPGRSHHVMLAARVLVTGPESFLDRIAVIRPYHVDVISGRAAQQ